MADCPIHGPQSDPPPSGYPDEAFEQMVSALVTLYLLGREVPTDDEGQALVTIQAEHDDEHGIFMLKIGLGQDAHTVMRAEHTLARPEEAE